MSQEWHSAVVAIMGHDFNHLNPISKYIIKTHQNDQT